MQYHCSNLQTGEHQGNVHDFDCTKQKMAIKQMKTMQSQQINGKPYCGSKYSLHAGMLLVDHRLLVYKINIVTCNKHQRKTLHGPKKK